MPNNQYVNKVEKSDGTTLIDITDTTAVASDVASGKDFYLATGEKVTGTSSGGGSVVVVDTPDSHGGTIREITAASVVSLHNSSTVTPTESVQTILPLSGYSGFRSVTVEAIPSAYIIPSGSLSITENGTYNVEAFATAEVMVQGGGGNSKENEIVDGTLSGIYTNSTVSFIRAKAFDGFSLITEVSFQNVISIGSYAFSNCASLTKANFPNAEAMTGIGVFSSCGALAEVSFPSLKSINGYVFHSCTALSEAVFPEVSAIGASTFYNCTSLTKASFPKATYISPCAFYSCHALSQISFPNVKSINSSAFNVCVSLTNVLFPNVYSVAASAFANCYNLTTVILNNTAEKSQSFYTGAFRNCYNLLSLYLLSSTSIYALATNVFSSTPIGGYTTSTGGVYGSVFVPSEIYDTYISATNWAAYSARIVSLTGAQVQHVIDYGTHEM